MLSRAHSSGVQKKPHHGREASTAAGQGWGERKGVFLVHGVSGVFRMIVQQRVLELRE